MDLLKANISLISNSILENYFESNGKVVLTNKDISKEYYKGDVKGSLSGLYDGNNKILYISANKYFVNDATIHEFGHVLDSLTSWTTINDKDNVGKIYKEEKDTFKTLSKVINVYYIFIFINYYCYKRQVCIITKLIIF